MPKQLLFGYKTLLKGQTLSMALSSGQKAFNTALGNEEVAPYPEPAYSTPIPSITRTPAPPPIVSSQPVSSSVTTTGQPSKATAFIFHKKKTIVKPFRSSWKIYISRTIFTLFGLALIFLLLDPTETVTDKFELILGMLIITSIPIIIGIILEFSYRKRRQIISEGINFASSRGTLLNNMTFSPLPSPDPVAEKPQIYNYRLDEVKVNKFGKRYLPPKKEIWKALLSRLIFSLIALIWLLVFWDYDSLSDDLFTFFFGMIFLTIIPFMIALMLELSYQRRKRTIILLD